MKRSVYGWTIAWCLGAAHAFAQAPGFPTKPVRWVVPFPAGGSADLMARMTAPELGKALGQQVVIENRPGASAIVGAEYVAKAAADGHTLLQCNVGQFTINPSLYPKLPYDSGRDFAPITVIASIDNVMVVTPSLPVKSVRELIELARRRPGELNFTSSGAGSLTHLTGELMKLHANIRMTHISYKGSAPAAVDTMAGFVQIMFDNLPATLENIKAGRLRALAILNRLDLVLAAYNAGENAVIRYGHRIPPFPETRMYVPAVLAKYREWQDLAPVPAPAAAESMPTRIQYMPGTTLDREVLQAAGHR